MNDVRPWLERLRNLFTPGLFNRRARRASRRPRMSQWRWGFRPVVEMLESRITLTANNYYLVTSLAEGAGTLTTVGSGIDGSQAHPFQDTTLRGAIAAATADGGDDTIIFDSALFTSNPGTITLSTVGDTTAGNSDFGISTNITIVGPSGNYGLTLSNSGVTQRFFYVGATGSLTLQNLTLTGGKSQGGSSGAGGGGAGMGGAIFNQGALNLVSSTLTGNTAQGGSGVGFAFSNGLYGGGGLGNGGNNQVNGDNPNGGSYSGGVGGFGGGGAKGGTFVSNAGNGGFGGGGGGTAYHGSLGGYGGFGGGGGMGFQTDLNRSGGFGGGAAFDRFPYAGGGGAGMGGAIFNAAGSVTITNSTLSGNLAHGGGGTSISTNRSGNGSGFGGAVFNLNGSLTLINDTLADNTVAAGTGGAGGSADGGAVYSLGMDNVYASGSGTGATIGTAAGAAITTYNTIFANDIGDTADLVNNNSTVTGSNNLDTGTSGLTAGISTTVTATALNLATSLAGNGGPTQTLALGSGSAAINAGLDTTQSPYNLSTDQRGGAYARRGSSAVDIGAYEVQPLATTALLEGPGAGSDSDIVITSGSWTATSNASWLHTTSSGTGSGLATFTFDANSGATRTGTLTIDGTTLTVTQAGAGYSHAGDIAILGSASYAPNWITADSSGNVYFSDSTHGTINEWGAATQTVTTLLSGRTNPQGIAVDAQGNVFFADYSDGAVYKLAAGAHSATLLYSSGFHPRGLALDSQGNIYLALPDGNMVLELNSSGAVVGTPYSNGSAAPVGVAVDAAGELYIADPGQHAIIAWNPTTQTGSTLVSGLNVPYAVAVDGSGNVYYSVQGSGNSGFVAEWFAATQTVGSISSGNANGVAVDVSGNVFTGIPAASPATAFLRERPGAYVPTSSFNEAYTSGSDAMAAVAPTTQPLTGIYAPSSDASWLTVGTISGGVINFSFSKNTGVARTAHLTVLGDTITVNQAASPSISFSATTPLNLGNVVPGTPGTPVTFTVSGSHLVANVTLTPPTGVELSTDGTTYFSTPISLTPSSGTLTSTTIYARIRSSASIGAISGNIAITSTDATEQDVSVSGVVGAQDLTIAKTHTGTFHQGDSADAYSITVTNSGSVATSGLVTVTDAMPTGLTLTRATGTGWTISIVNNTLTATRSDALGAGSSYPVLSLTVSVAQTAATSLNNTATVSGGGESNTANDSSTDTTTITPLADLTIVKTVTPTTVIAGANLLYTYTITNTGPSNAATVRLLDALPSSTVFVSQSQTSGPAFTLSRTGNAISDTIASLTSGSTAVITVMAGTNTSLANDTTIVNTATVSTSTTESSTSNNSSTATSTVAVAGVGLSPSALDPTKSDLVVGSPTAGGTIQFVYAASGKVTVTINGASQGTFSPTGELVAIGHAGTNVITVDPRITVPVIVIGGTGNNSLSAGGGNAVLVGGAGAVNVLNGGSGRNILIGGPSAARIYGGSPSGTANSGSIMIAGSTIYDHNVAALANLLQEWGHTYSTNALTDYTTRISHLRTGAGLAGGFKLDNSTVIASSFVDQLFASVGLDWYWDPSNRALKPNRKAGTVLN